MCECEHLVHKRPASQKGKIMASHCKGPRDGCLLAADHLKLTSQLMKTSAIFQSCSVGETKGPCEARISGILGLPFTWGL